MLNITLNPSDCIETLLPAIEGAMDAGEVCRLVNVNFLGPLEIAALSLLVMAANLQDTATGRICHARSGFALIGVDQAGVSKRIAG